MTLDDINKSVFDLVRREKLKTASNSTANRVTALIRAILMRAKNDWEWIDTVPTFRALPEPKGRVRWLSVSEAELLLAELPTHLNAMVRFTLATGLRESNVTHLEWSQIDMQRRCAWVHAEQAKAGKAIPVPLNDDALTVIREQIGKHDVRVFTYKGNVVNDANTKAWRFALARAGIKNFRWHDLRHTWASWHVQAGTPLHVLKELGGWSDLTMVSRYAHLSSAHLEAYAGNTNRKSGDKKATHLKIVKPKTP